MDKSLLKSDNPHSFKNVILKDKIIVTLFVFVVFFYIFWDEIRIFRVIIVPRVWNYFLGLPALVHIGLAVVLFFICLGCMVLLRINPREEK